MHKKRLVQAALGAGLVLSFGIFGQYMAEASTVMSTETELAGMSYTLDQYCDVQTGANQTNPEAIVAFDDAASDDKGDTTVTVTSGSAVSSTQPGTTELPAASSTPKPESEYANVGISIAADYVNIRKKPNTDAEIVGKLYRGSAATIMSTEGDWVYIKSGSVSGYINKDYLAIGYSAEKLIDEFGTKWATVTTETLKVREEKNTECAVLTLIPEDESYEVIREETDWAKIRVDGETTGYVSKDYVEVSVQFKKAVSIEEEREEARRKAAAKAAAEQAEREAQERKEAQERAEQQRKEEAKQKAAQQHTGSSTNTGHSSSGSGNKSSSGTTSSNGGGGKSGSTTSSNGGGGKSGSTTSSNGGGGSAGSSSSSDGGGGSTLGSGDGSAVASYALNFVGNPYVYGGTSLTQGTDCSGFTQSVFRKFGISLPRTSGEQSRTGKKISVSSARAGDLIFYTSGGRVNHVALCIGGGRVVHASNPRVGITTSNMYYRTPYCARRVIG